MALETTSTRIESPPPAPALFRFSRWVLCAMAVGCRALAASVMALTTAVSSAQAQVLDVVELPSAWKLHELSGLAWPDGRTLFAVSDRGRLWRLDVRIDRAAGQPRLQLGSAPLRIALDVGKRLNAEAITWRAADGMLLIADEAGHYVLAVDLDGHTRATLPLPAGTSGGGANSGVEAMDWHPAHGLLAALQRPARGADKSVHVVHSADGRAWAFGAADGGKSSLKALEVLAPDDWLVLEKIDRGTAHDMQLRRLTGC